MDARPRGLLAFLGGGVAAAVLALACSGSSSTSRADGPDAALSPTSPEAGSPGAVKVGSVRATIRYSGTVQGQLSVGAFRENPPKTKPPVAFDTSKTPSFPYEASLRGIEPGTYWIIAVLDLPPLSPGNVVPGPEDLLGTSEPIQVTGNDALQVEVTIADPIADAGAD